MEKGSLRVMNDLFAQNQWNKFDKRVTIIGNPNEFLAKGMGEAFKNKSFRVYLCKNSIDAISQLPDEVRLYIVILDSIAEYATLLTYLKDRIYEQRICVCVICQKGEINEINKIVPTEDLAKIYFRPVNAREIVQELNDVYDKPQIVQQQKSILIVDDDPDFLRRTQQILKKYYKVYIANSGASALMILSKYTVDLILLDYNMPVLDGLKTMEALKSEPATADIPVMFLTGMGDMTSVTKAVALKPARYILKTTSAGELLVIISDFFSSMSS